MKLINKEIRSYITSNTESQGAEMAATSQATLGLLLILMVAVMQGAIISMPQSKIISTVTTPAHHRVISLPVTLAENRTEFWRQWLKQIEPQGKPQSQGETNNFQVGFTMVFLNSTIFFY